MVEWIGWVATAVFAVSYFCRKAEALRRVQAFAALLWIGYGIVIKAPPVIVANVVVAAIALLSSLQSRTAAAKPETAKQGAQA
ncbi:MAG: YgjV family protein [Blastocatellia bacterium]|nr:YgjV family protein [Blastocatellia bacterium]